jgi:hypothetical protein
LEDFLVTRTSTLPIGRPPSAAPQAVIALVIPQDEAGISPQTGAR